MGDFRKLVVWQNAHPLTLKIYKLTSNLPKSETFGLISQIRRAAVSIEANIAEGEGRFHYKDKMLFFYNARGSCVEVKALLLVIKDLYNSSAQESEKLFEDYCLLEKQLNTLISYRKGEYVKKTL